MALPAVKHMDPVVGIDVHSVIVTPGLPPVFLPHPHIGFMLDLREYIAAAKGVIGSIAMTIAEDAVLDYLKDHPDDRKKLTDALNSLKDQKKQATSDPWVAKALKLNREVSSIKGDVAGAVGAGVGMGAAAGRPIFVNGLMRATAGTHSFHVPGLHFPLGETFAPPDPLPSDDAESYMGSRTVLANNDPMSFLALPAMSCWAEGIEPPPHNGAHTTRTHESMPSSVMLPIPVGRPVLVGGPPVMNMAAAAKGMFKAFQGSKWAKNLADKLHLKSGFLRCTVLKAEPVDVTTGEVVVQQNDFTVSGRLPLVWDRYYASQDRHPGAVGFGWQTPADIRLELMRNEDGIGAVAHFPDHATAFNVVPADDGWPARTYDWQHGHALYGDDGRMVLRTREGIEYGFVLPSRWRDSVAALDGDDSRLTLPIDRMADLNGNAWVFERDMYGGLVRLVEWKRDGQTERLVECGTGRGLHAGLLTSLTLIDAGGNAHPLVSYEHDRERNLAAAIDAMAHPHHFEYAVGHRMVSHTSARGVSFYYSYQQDDDGVWRVDHAWGDNGLFDYRFVYDRARMETRIIDSLGHTTLLQLNERGIPVARIDALGGITSYRYDAQWRTCEEVAPSELKTQWVYDRRGRLIAKTLPDNSVVRCETDADGRPVRVIDPGNRAWRYEWDACGNLVERTSPWGATDSFEYDAIGQLVAHRGTGGAVTCFEHDGRGNVSAIVDHLGNRTEYRYDAFGNVVQMTAEDGGITVCQRDANGNITRTNEPGGRETFRDHDADGNLIAFRDRAGNVTRFAYAASGMMSMRIMPDGSTIEYCYDTEARLTGVINERGQSYQIERDALGRVVAEVDYWGQRTTYEYGVNGALASSTSPTGRAITYETDPLGRVIRKRLADARQITGSRLEIFEYDAIGNLVVAENPDVRVEIRYDEEGRVVEERQGDDFTIVSKYDSLGNRIARRTRLDLGDKTITHSVRYNYDAVGNCSAVQIDDTAPITIERGANGRTLVEQRWAASTLEQSWSADGRLVRQALLSECGPMFATEYLYDNYDDLIEKRDSKLGTERFQYDPMRRLLAHWDHAGQQHRYPHDRAGNLLQEQGRYDQPENPDHTSGPSGPWIREAVRDGRRYLFDRTGSLVRKHDDVSDLTLRWDDDELLIETIATHVEPSDPNERAPTSIVRAEYVYDALRRRIGKFTYEPSFELQARCDAQAIEDWRLVGASRFFWDGAALVAERSIDSRDARSTGRDVVSGEAGEWISYPMSHRPLAWVRCLYTMQRPSPSSHDLSMSEGRLSMSEEVRHLFYNDCNGAPMRVLSESGRILWESRSDAWGRADCRRADLEQPLRLQGQYADVETGLHYNFHRYYDPDLGAFISQDPVRLLGGLNLYSFAPSTLNWIDPLGLLPWSNNKYTSPPNKVKATIVVSSPGGVTKSGEYESKSAAEHAELIGIGEHRGDIPKNRVTFEDVEGLYWRGSKAKNTREEEWLPINVCTMVCRPTIFLSLHELEVKEVEFPHVSSYEMRGKIIVPSLALEEAHDSMVKINRGVVDRIPETTKNYKMVRGSCAAREQLRWFVARGFYHEL
ncbi:RHS repeat-associated core domain protein [Burkholderia thailandensis MSMB121]|uniref:RHS repeat-associated core domain-containing protein n=1 Tax=Burkholderia humptydooensis TaxID=430531 RepID=UPI00032807CE|nr:RHS repeat-associated core domain-containing protein [Burkholderia humptydooensis]AGK51390.1 RHS repeat-associated core domain protein [Burkholderia thailandensis MSMB121]ATF33602.1 type IV secretion protein Rhs [Burkholderia thailandensis]KST71677.1 type IV secretion protein Rhs [Burkholderia humptydooensis]